MQGLNWQTWTMRFLGGLNQKSDPRTLDPPELTIAKDVAFDKIGGLRTRYPFTALGSNIFGGGTIANPRRLVAFGDELLLFTKDKLYSWSAQLSKWVSKGTHLAVKIDETPRFIRTTDQTECDRAELSNVIVHAWAESGHVFWGAHDKTTNAELVTPQDLGEASRPRVVALDTKILLFYSDTLNGDLVVFAIDPANLSDTLGSGAIVVAAAAFNDYYDVTKIIGADSAAFVSRRTVTTSYEVGKVTAGLVVTTSTKARTCDGPIALSSSPTGTHIQVARINGTDLQGDLVLVSTLADVYTAQAIGTIDGTAADRIQIAMAHRSVQDSGQYRCYVFWSSNVSSLKTSTFVCRSNWVNTGNTLGAAATFVRRLDPCSRAFDYDGRVYFWGTFAFFTATGEIENTQFLFRDDGFVVAKAVADSAAVEPVSWLPGVALTSGTTFARCATWRSAVDASAEYTDRSPRDVVWEFDSNEARRTAILGRTMYVSGAEVMQYDGTSLSEVGFHYWPPGSALSSDAASGSIEAGSYFYKHSYRWVNAAGEIERSAAVDVFGPVAFVGAPPHRTVINNVLPLFATHKGSAPNIEFWRTAKNVEAPFYLVTSRDPTDASNPNRYLPNDTTSGGLSFTDELADALVTIREEFPQDGILESLAPPPAKIVVAGDTRLFLAGVAHEPNRIWYSKQRNDGEVAAFNDTLVVDIPASSGPVTALAYVNETLVVFTETAVYALTGSGLGNAGDGLNFEPRRISGDIGAVTQDGVASTDRGVIFKSRKGWYLLNRGWALDYIGGPVCDYDSETPLSIDVVESQHQIRILTASRMLVFDTLASDLLQRPVWSEWTVSDGLHSCIWSGAHAYLTSTGPKTQQSTYTGLTYGIDVETAWIKLADLQGFARVRWFQTLGEYRSAHKLHVRVAINYNDTYIDDEYWAPSPTTVGGPEQVEHGPTEQQIQAIKVRLTAVDASNTSNPPSGEALQLSGLAFMFGLKQGLFRRLPAEQKV